MCTSAGKNPAPLQSIVHLIMLYFICLCFGTCYAKTKCLIGSVLALKCSLWYVRPLQINSLFPVHRPHLVTASSKYSIIPYSSIIFRLFLHTDRLSKSYLETVSAHVSAVLSSRQNFTFVLFLQLTKEGTSLSMLLCSLFGCARQIMA